jgi:hypothetical protein
MRSAQRFLSVNLEGRKKVCKFAAESSEKCSFNTQKRTILCKL